MPLLAERLEPLLADGRVARWQLDTYVREVERYGGEEGVVLAERLFSVDSAYVLDVLSKLSGDEGLDWRWKLALCGVDTLLNAFGFDLERKCEWVRRQRDAFAREFRVDAALRRQLGDKYRLERASVDELLRLASSTPALAQHPVMRAFQERTLKLLPIARALLCLEHGARLSMPISDVAPSYAHMHINRMLRSAHRFQELAIYELLDRTYRAQIAQARQRLLTPT